jgi:hypothetical protein
MAEKRDELVTGAVFWVEKAATDPPPHAYGGTS